MAEELKNYNEIAEHWIAMANSDYEAMLDRICHLLAGENKNHCSMDKERVLKIAKEYVNYLITNKKIDIRKAYLFGSYAKGTQTSTSDIDIALVVPNHCDTFDMLVQLMLLSRNFSLDIEPHPVREEDFSEMNPFASEVISTGINLAIV